MSEPCKYRRRPTGPREFFNCGRVGEPPDRLYCHIECMLDEGRKIVESGEFDDLRVAINWPNGPAEITTGKQIRQEQIEHNDPADQEFIDQLKKAQERHGASVLQREKAAH